MGNIDPSTPHAQDPVVHKLERASSWGYVFSDLTAVLGFGFLLLGMTFGLCKMTRNSLFMVSAFLCFLNYTLQFALLDWQYIKYSQFGVQYTPFLETVVYFGLTLVTIGHYLLVAAYFRYGMLVAPKFTAPSDQ